MVIAAEETVTEMVVLRALLSLTLIVQEPAATGVMAYVALPLVVVDTATVAIVPEYGLHVSLSVNAPV
jgi:hypothetical protein